MDVCTDKGGSDCKASEHGVDDGMGMLSDSYDELGRREGRTATDDEHLHLRHNPLL